MKNLNLITSAALLALAATTSIATAGTLSGGATTLNGVSTTTNPPKITAAGQIIQVKHAFGVLYYGPDKSPAFPGCNAKLEYSDGTPPEMITIKSPAEGVARMRQYTKPGKYTVSLTGVANGALVGCLGSAQTSLTIEDAIPAAPKKAGDPGATMPGITPMGLQAAQGMAPINGKTHVKLVQLTKGDTFPPGDVLLYSKFAIEKPENNCFLEYSVSALSDSGQVTGPNLVQLPFGGNMPNMTGEFNPGSFHFTNTGKFRVTLKARTDVPDNRCTGHATDDFEIKRQKIFGNAPAPAPTPTYGSFISKITAVEHANSWDITVHGAGDKPCKYHVEAWTLPGMSIFGEQAMVYEKGVAAPGKGAMTVPKQDGKKVLIKTIATASDQVDNQSCLGTPSLELTSTL